MTWLNTDTFTGCVRGHSLDFVALLVTGKRDFRWHVLTHLAGSMDFTRNCCLPPRGRSGGIFLGSIRLPLNWQQCRLGNFMLNSISNALLTGLVGA